MKYVYKGKNIDLIEVASSLNKNLVILGNGFSVPKVKKYKWLGTTLMLFFKNGCTGLEEAQQELAEFINKEYDKYQRVILYGHSKWGVMFFKMLPLIEKPVVSISVSAPFKGTFWADVEQVKKVLWTNRSFTQKLLKGWQYVLYRILWKDNSVNRDIIPNSQYLRKERLIPKCHKTIFIETQCLASKGSFWQYFSTRLNSLAGYKRGDGLVESGHTNSTFTVTSTHFESFNGAMFVLKNYLL